jgi:hypothetical protein
MGEGKMIDPKYLPLIEGHSNQELASEILAFILKRYPRDSEAYKQQNPDLWALSEADVSEEAARHIVGCSIMFVDIFDEYMTEHETMAWRLLITCMVGEYQITSKIMVPIIDDKLDEDKQQKAYMTKSDLIMRAPKIRKENADLMSLLMGVGDITEKAVRRKAKNTRSIVMAEGYSEEADG